MRKHPAGPFTVRVTLYDLAPNCVGNPAGQIYSSRHRAPKAAARRLAMLISNRTALARHAHACIPAGFGSKWLIETGNGSRFSLVDFRKRFAAE